jgi:hypothetical protein
VTALIGILSSKFLSREDLDRGKHAMNLKETLMALDEQFWQASSAANASPLQSNFGLCRHALVGTLQITFVHNEPDLLREVPAVPG